VPFNESWGVPDLPAVAAQRHYVQGLYHLTKTLDPQRPVIGNDGWESVATDILGIHDYDDSPDRIAERYATPDLLPKILKHERPGGRALVVDARPLTHLPVVLSEFGGITVKRPVGEDGDSGIWGYSSVPTTSELGARYQRLMESVRSRGLFAGFCYTQFADTYQEANGLLWPDRTPKIPLAEIHAATTGVAIDEEESSPPKSLAELAVTERGGAPE
jgi:hypothetical protein